MSNILHRVHKHVDIWFIVAVLLFVNLYSLPTLTTKPAYWYDEAINVELARNFADFGKLDLIIAPSTFSEAGATVGSTGYPVTLPLAGFFKAFGFGLTQARLYMLLWMSACIIAFFFFAKKLWGSAVAYGGTLLIVTFAPFYGNGRSVMGEIPGFLFFLLSFYFLERKKYWWSGILLGLSVVSKPSVFVFLIPAYALVLLLGQDEWRKRIANLMRVGFASMAALVPWVLIYAEELARGGLGENILAHFKNPYREVGVSIGANISHNLGTFFQSTTILYFTALFVLIIAALYLNRELFRTHQSIFILSAVYLPLAFFQYLKSFGYLRYIIAAEFLVFILFLIALPVLVRRLVGDSPFVKGSTEPFSQRAREGFPNPPSAAAATSFSKGGIIIIATLTLMVAVQTIHLFSFSDLYAGEKTQKTLAYLASAYPDSAIGVMNVPQVGSLIVPERKYQYLSTYGLWQFGVNSLLLPPDRMPPVLVTDSDDPALFLFYERDPRFSDGFVVYKKK